MPRKKQDGKCPQNSATALCGKPARIRGICNPWTHPLGGKIRVTADGELVRSEAGRDGLALIDRGLEWKSLWQEKGWI